MLRGASVGFVAAFAAASASAIPPTRDARETIVVTGERVPRSLKQTDSSVVVVSQPQIEASGGWRADDVLANIPNVQLGSGSQGPAIRGLDTTGALQALPAFLGGNRPRTTIIVDGRAATYNEFVFGAFPLWDVNRIEVFRSPQTTTQGVNSIAGAIFVTSNDPDFKPEARMRLIGGDYRTGEVSTVISGAVSRDVALRVAGDLRYSRTTSAIAHTMAGADPNHEASGILRTKLLIEPDQFNGSRLLLTYAHSVSQSPQIVGVTAPFRERRDESATYGVFRVRTDSVTAAARFELGEGLTANALLTAGTSNARRFAMPGLGETRNQSRDWSGEAALNWSREGQLKLIGGVSHVHLTLKQSINLSLLSGLKGSFHDWQDSTGLFGEAIMTVATRTTVSAGLRYQQDEQVRQGALVTNAFSLPADFVGRFHAWLPKVSVAYDFSTAWRGGILVQKAYNPGGTTIRFDTARPNDFAAETLWDTELFARGSLLGSQMQIGMNVFNYAMRNAQRAEPITIVIPSGRRVGFANLFNVLNARSRGVEATVIWRATNALTTQLSLGFLATRITRIDAQHVPSTGNQFDRSPRFSAAVGIDWRPANGLQVSAQVRHHSHYYSDNANSPDLVVDAATIADARAEYRLKRVSLFVQLRNVFGTFGMLSLSTPTSGEGEDPRRIMAGVETRF